MRLHLYLLEKRKRKSCHNEDLGGPSFVVTWTLMRRIKHGVAHGGDTGGHGRGKSIGGRLFTLFS
jgi:hypothetical protein